MSYDLGMEGLVTISPRIPTSLSSIAQDLGVEGANLLSAMRKSAEERGIKFKLSKGKPLGLSSGSWLVVAPESRQKFLEAGTRYWVEAHE